MHRSFAWGVIAILAIMLAPFAGVFGVPAGTAHAETAAPTAAADDEIIVITSAGVVRVDDPTTPTGPKTSIWTSASELGWETSWTVVAAGDFNGDGDAELVAARNTASGSYVKVFDPVVQPGRTKVNYSVNLGSGNTVRFLVTGDFDADGKDEFAVMHYVSGGARLVWYDGGANAAEGDWTQQNSASYVAMFQDMSTGDFNNDGADDLVLVRNKVLTTTNMQTLSTIAERTDSPLSWYAVAGGNLDKSTSAPGDEIAASRDFFDNYQTMVPYKYVSNKLEVLKDNTAWSYNPPMPSISNGDLNGDGDDEVVLLRDPLVAKASLLMVNPAGAPMSYSFEQATGYGSSAFRIVRTGDTDGDGKDEIVILKGDRYRIYTDPDVGSQATETTGSFYAPSSSVTGYVSNLPYMTLANVDGVASGPTLSVTPASLSYSLDYGAVSPIQSLAIANVGSGSIFPWQATVLEGGSWLLLNGASNPVLGNTPGQVNVSVKTDVVAPGTYTGKIRISTTDSSVLNAPVDVTVTLTVRDPGFAAFPSDLTIWQKIGGNPPPPTVTREVKIVRPVKSTPWTATALSLDQAAVLMEKLAIGQATVAAAGSSIDGVLVPPPDWLVFTPDHDDKTPSTMTVSVKLGTAAGTYHGVIVIAAGDPSLPEAVQSVYVTAVVADHFHFTFLPLVTK
jgi:hypothetical protein